jgi:hypothetical protein
MATDEAQGQARPGFASLPHALVLAVFARLPVDARARCAAVCRGWRATVSEPCIWTRLNLSPSSGVRVRVADDVLHAASGLARGALAALDVSGCPLVTLASLLAVATSNARALTELRLQDWGTEHRRLLLTCPNAEALLLAAPLLRVLQADVRITAAEVARMLHNEAPVGPLRVRRLEADFREADAGVTAEATVAIVAHASLSSVHLSSARLDVPGALDALVDAALARRLSAVTFSGCRLSPASGSALARLLGGSALTELNIFDNGVQLLDAPAAVLLGDALRANSMLTKLTLVSSNLFADPAAAAALLGALTGHASLRSLAFSSEETPTEQAVAFIAPALAALVAADTPALEALFVHCNLGDAGMRPLLEALPHNTHLKRLMCAGNRLSAAFARDVLLPAVRANTSLLTLNAGVAHEAEVEANARVDARTAVPLNARWCEG